MSDEIDLDALNARIEELREIECEHGFEAMLAVAAGVPIEVAIKMGRPLRAGWDDA